MGRMLAVVADKVLTGVAKKLAKTGCYYWCKSQDIPEELL
jgi:hypothetical protein